MATNTDATAKSSSFPLWGKILTGIVVLLILLVLTLPYFLNVDRYRDTIVSALEKQTGRKVSLGPIHARFFPGAGVTVSDLHVSNPSDFPTGDLIGADELRVNVALAPLLHGTIHVNSVDLVRPKLTVLTDAGGKNNYTFTPTEPAEPAKPGDTSSVTLDQIDSINLTGAEIIMGSVVRGAVAPLVDTKGISVTLHNFAVSPMRMHDWQAESNLSSVTLALSGWKAPISFHTGQFTLSGGKLDAQFVADLATAADIKGTVDVPDFEHPQVNFEMSSSQLDIDKLIDVAGSATGSPVPEKTITPSASAPGKTGAKAGEKPAPKPSDKPAASSPASELVAKGHINIEKITTKPYTVGPANVEMRVYTDRAELWPISIGMYGGTLQLSSRVDRVTDPARFTANVQMRNLDVAKVLDVSSAARGKMGGTGELDLQLLGSLSEAWKKTLSGSGKFAVRNGHLPGVNLAGAAESAMKMAGVGGDTPFTVLEGDINIANQSVTSKLIHLDSSVGVVDLHGSLGMDSTLNYDGTATVNPLGALGTGKVGGIVGGLVGARVGKITVPFSLGGTISDPKVRPGKGVPSMTAGSTPAVPALPTQVPTPQQAVDTFKNLFNKKK
ncbi:MAG TPA: AsmA family protein [Candidatus Acidoferrales bacterium]|nr:AsmA family protein [Candidatus Acidoferrales bacterium]